MSHTHAKLVENVCDIACDVTLLMVLPVLIGWIGNSTDLSPRRRLFNTATGFWRLGAYFSVVPVTCERAFTHLRMCEQVSFGIAFCTLYATRNAPHHCHFRYFPHKNLVKNHFQTHSMPHINHPPSCNQQIEAKRKMKSFQIDIKLGVIISF